MSSQKVVVSKVFSSVSRKYDFFLKSITLGKINRWQEALIENMGNIERLLDVGTGTGEVLLKARKASFKVGIDLSPGMLKIAKEKCTSCYFLLGDAENLPIKDSAFDGITLSLTYRHLLNRELFLKEANRVLTRGGKIGILDINKFFLTTLLMFLMKYPLRPLGVLLFGNDKWEFFIHSLENTLSINQITQELESFGFKKIKELTYMMGIVYVLVFEKV